MIQRQDKVALTGRNLPVKSSQSTYSGNGHIFDLTGMN